ncbi:hypothetical protein ACHAW5_005303 [Stephanodiscus triporus]|uniref:Uncharacterized protein n=1 Tax=Stephanodiscus triporus TaxID=2934178 RepID=A0ABD3PB10_9STRA
MQCDKRRPEADFSRWISVELQLELATKSPSNDLPPSPRELNSHCSPSPATRRRRTNSRPINQPELSAMPHNICQTSLRMADTTETRVSLVGPFSWLPCGCRAVTLSTIELASQQSKL